MFTDFLGGFLGALGGVAAGVLGLKYLSGKFIELQISKVVAEHKHGLDKQLTALQTQLSRFSDVLSRRNEREFAVTEGTWERIIKAVGTAQNELGDGKNIIAFALMSESDALGAIEKLWFTDEEKESLRNATSGTKRADLHLRYDLRVGVRKCMTQWGELKNWISTHQIFLHVKVLSAALKIQNELYGILVDVEGYAEDLEVMPLDERIAIKKRLRDEFNKAIDDLAEVIRARFGFAEDEPAAV
jgi:CHAD domain-containing protein